MKDNDNLTIDEMRNKKNKEKKMHQKRKQHKKINKDFEKFKRNLDEKFNDEIDNEISDESDDDVFNAEKSKITLINKKKKIMKKCEMRMIKKSFNLKTVKTESRLKSESKHHYKTVSSDKKKNFEKKTHLKKYQINNSSRNSFTILHNFHTDHYILFNLVKHNVEHFVMSRFKSFSQYDDFTLYINSKLS